jgi:hypothetical protein
LGGGCTGAGAQRRRPAAGAARPVPARPAPGRGKVRQGWLQGRLGRVWVGLHGTGGSGTASTADGDRRRAPGKRGAHSREGMAGTVFMGGSPTCATSPYARRCLGARGTLVDVPGGEGSRRTAGLCANAEYGSVRRGRCARTSRAPQCACGLGKERRVGRKLRRRRPARGGVGRRAARRLDVATASATEQCS